MTEAEYKRAFSEPPSKDATEKEADTRAGRSAGRLTRRRPAVASEKEADTRAGRALALALDIRKFEIELYWKRATYFWGFIAAAFAGYALTYKSAADHEPWLGLLFSSLGLVFSWAWFLVNRGSKFWQQNWERHVDLLEGMTLGPLYKTMAVDPNSRNPLTAAGRFSVTKINQMLSAFVTLIWVVLCVKSLWPLSLALEPDYFRISICVVTAFCLFFLWLWGRSATGVTQTRLETRVHKTDA